MECPWCKISIEVEQVNCGIFRCGILKATGTQIPQHLPKEAVETILPLIWGCGNPFKLNNGVLVKCGWDE